MRIDEVKAGNVTLTVSESELRLIQGALREVSEAIDEFEFHSRVGGAKADVRQLAKVLRRAMEQASIAI